jgi:DDE family transposase
VRSERLSILRRPQEFVNDLWVVNDRPDPDPVAEKHMSAELKHRSRRPRGRDSRRSAINEFSLRPVDPDAQTFRKPGMTPILGHKTHLLVDGGRATIITVVEARGACEADGNAVGTLLDQHRLILGRAARDLVGDRGYGSEAAIQMGVERNVQPLLGVRASTNPHGGLDRTAFTYVAARDLYICPQGKELRHAAENLARRQTVYKPVRGTCRSCPIRAQCAPTATADRVITRRWDADLVEAMQARFATRRGRALLRQRHIVSERINADAKEKHEFAKAQFRGRAQNADSGAAHGGNSQSQKTGWQATRSAWGNGGDGGPLSRFSGIAIPPNCWLPGISAVAALAESDSLKVGPWATVP